MSDFSGCLSFLLEKSKKQGYLTFDDILDTSDSYNLSLFELNNLNEAIQIRGIIVYEEEPAERITEEEYEDYSKVDYSEIYNEIIQISPELEYVVNLIKSIPPPQYKEISLLTVQNYNGNLYAREKLILIHLRLVLKIALAMSKENNFNLTEAVSCGFCGLITAVDRFDPDGFSAFQSYASLWIQQHIQRECAPEWMEFYYPYHYKEKLIPLYKRLNKETSADIQIYDIDELTKFTYTCKDELGLESEKVNDYVRNLYNQLAGHLYLDDIEEGQQDSSLNIINKNPDYYVDCNELAEELISKNELKQSVLDILKTLTPREEKVMCMRFGIGYANPMTLEEVGNLMGVTRERIRQIEAKAIRKLRHPARNKVLKCYLD